MIKQLESEIRDLKRKLVKIQKGQADLRLQPCRGDSEIKGKDAKINELERRAKEVNETLRGVTRKRQLLISQSTIKGTYKSAGSSDSL